MIINKKWMCGFAVLLLIVWAVAVQGAPPIPAKIGGTVTVDGTQLTQTTDVDYRFVATKQDTTTYRPEAKDSDGLNSSAWYVINVPIYHATGQTGGAKPGDTALIRVYKDGSELKVVSPHKGSFSVGQSGSTTRIDLVLKTGKNEKR